MLCADQRFATQMKDSTSASPSGSHAGVEAVGNVMPGTGDVVVSQPQFKPTTHKVRLL